MPDVRKTPCPACPYRRDVPPGVWAAEEYSKLRKYEGETFEQNMAVFACHATPEKVCHGWACVSDAIGEADPRRESLSFRLHQISPPPPAVPLFASHEEAATHGLSRITDPPQGAAEAIERLRRYPRLRDQAPS